MKKIVALTAVLGVLMASTSFAAEEVPVAAASTGTTTQGSQLMTQQERAEHRNKMQSAKTEQERQQIRAENHETMRKRAEERGMSMPENAPSTGMHQGRGMQGGAGMGRGGPNR